MIKVAFDFFETKLFSITDFSSRNCVQPMISAYKERVFNIQSSSDFDKLCLEVFRYQSIQNSVYANYLQQLKIDATAINSVKEIPFLPIEFFKTRKIVSGDSFIQKTFESSGTSGAMTSKHFVSDISLYEESFLRSFELFYGDVHDWCVLALLPNYLERSNSSLVYMMDHLIKRSNHPDSAFHLDDIDILVSKIKKQEAKKEKTWLIGTSYALLDMAENHPQKLKNTLILETGGMKGKRKEMVRKEMHDFLCEKFGVKEIHSEYGMTELLSQAYSSGNGFFKCPPWMKVTVRDTNDPFALLSSEKTGGLNIIDLVNVNSCSFIATQDLGKLHKDGSFEMLGRFDNSDIRGCNLLVE